MSGKQATDYGVFILVFVALIALFFALVHMFIALVLYKRRGSFLISLVVAAVSLGIALVLAGENKTNERQAWR